MGIGTCLLSNEPEDAKNQLIQARIDGKTWKQIQEEFGFSSVQVARKTFRKVTGINNLQVKGKELKNMLDAGMMDELKAGLPKKPPKIKPPSTPEEGIGSDAWAKQMNEETAQKYGFTAAPGQTGSVLQGEVGDLMSAAFPDEANKIFLEDYAEHLHFQKASTQAEIKKALLQQQTSIQNVGGSDTAEKIIAELKQGQFYGALNAKYGAQFADIDALYWGDALPAASFESTNSIYSAVWDAYTNKPTSEFGFKAVQDVVWNLKKAGATQAGIVDATGIDKNVVDLILKDNWSLPGKGSKTYVGYNSPAAASSYSTSYSTTTSQLLGESNSFGNMSKANVDGWIQTLGTDMTSQQRSYWSQYSGSFYTEVNSELRSGGYRYGGSRAASAAKDMKETMRPLPSDYTLHRGVSYNAFPNGVPDVGMPYDDPGFISTSFGDHAAFSSRPVQMHIDAPAGTLGRPIYNISGFGMSEREIVLDAGTKFIVTGKQQIGSTLHLYLKVVP